MKKIKRTIIALLLAVLVAASFSFGNIAVQADPKPPTRQTR